MDSISYDEERHPYQGSMIIDRDNSMLFERDEFNDKTINSSVMDRN